MSKKNKKNKKIKSLVLLLFLTVVMLSTATYAWFTANKTVSVDTINVYIAASSGIQISTDASTWKTIISNSDIQTGYTGSNNVMNSTTSSDQTMVPVSTDGTVDTSTGYMKMFKGTVEGDSTNGGIMSLTTTAAAETSGNFVAFDVFIKLDTASQLYLESGSGVVYKSGTTDKGLQNAARYAFVIEGNTASSSTAATAQALKGASSTATIIEPNYDAHKSSGVTNASTYYGISTTAAESGVATINYYGVKAASGPTALANTNPPTLTAANTNFGVVQNLIRTNVAYSKATGTLESSLGTSTSVTTTTTTGQYAPVLNLSAGITKVRVYMWVEGQDVDCENDASGSNLTYKINLTLNNKPA